MMQSNIGLDKPRNEDVVMGPSMRPKGWGRRNPHCGLNTRKQINTKPEKQANKTALAISDGLIKIDKFFNKRNK